MKKVLLVICLCIVTEVISQSPGYEIKITLKPYKNEYIYLGHYLGKTYPVIDSAKLDEKSEAVFKGTKKLPGGIYLIGFPGRKGFFEFLVDKQQHFGIIADTLNLRKSIQYQNSPDNDLFKSYQQYTAEKGGEITTIKNSLSRAATPKDSSELIEKLKKLDKEVLEYRDELIKKNPQALLSALLLAMKEPVLPEKLQQPKTKADSVNAYNYYKAHYWEGTNFWDGRLAYTTFFEEKIDKYFETTVEYNPDSVIKEIDAMLGPATISDEMTRFLLIKFVNRYLNQKYMWEDAIMVHLFEKYFAQKEYPWLKEKDKKTITNRAYSLMANLMGKPAADIELNDSTGKKSTLYNVKAAYTLLVFWDPACDHCKELLPRVDSFYRAKWKNDGVKIYAVAKESDGNKQDWLNVINRLKLVGWNHVFYSKAEDDARINANIPGYSQLFDVKVVPTLYLLDKNKNIIAKKLNYSQINEILQLKIKGQ